MKLYRACLDDTTFSLKVSNSIKEVLGKLDLFSVASGLCICINLNKCQIAGMEWYWVQQRIHR